MNRILFVVAAVLFLLAAFVGAGWVDADAELLRWQVLVAFGLASVAAGHAA